MKRVNYIFKSSEELAEASKNAWSIGAYNQPVAPEYIGSCDEGVNIYHYYRDRDGKYYYESERGLQYSNNKKQKGEKRR